MFGDEERDAVEYIFSSTMGKGFVMYGFGPVAEGSFLGGIEE